MLPIHDIREQILQALRAGNRLVLTAPTGSGKTTQVPQFLLHADLPAPQIFILQPRDWRRAWWRNVSPASFPL